MNPAMPVNTGMSGGGASSYPRQGRLKTNTSYQPLAPPLPPPVCLISALFISDLLAVYHISMPPRASPPRRRAGWGSPPARL